MKKILFTIMLFVLGLGLMGCETIDPEVVAQEQYNAYVTEFTNRQEAAALAKLQEEQAKAAEELAFREDFREGVLDAITSFGNSPEDEDLDFYNGDEGFFGNARLIMQQEDEFAYVYMKDGAAIYFDVDYDEKSLNMFTCGGINIQYLDFNQCLNIDLYFYHYDDFLITNYSKENIPYNLNTFMNNLLRLEIEDWLWIISELGY